MNVTALMVSVCVLIIQQCWHNNWPNRVYRVETSSSETSLRTRQRLRVRRPVQSSAPSTLVIEGDIYRTFLNLLFLGTCDSLSICK